MTDGEGKRLGVASGRQQIASPSPAQSTATDQLLNHLRANNDHLMSCIADLRGFLTRAIGESPPNAPSTDGAVAQAGVLGAVDEALNDQTSLCDNIRECILVIEKVA